MKPFIPEFKHRLTSSGMELAVRAMIGEDAERVFSLRMIRRRDPINCWHLNVHENYVEFPF